MAVDPGWDVLAALRQRRARRVLEMVCHWVVAGQETWDGGSCITAGGRAQVLQGCGGVVVYRRGKEKKSGGSDCRVQ